MIVATRIHIYVFFLWLNGLNYYSTSLQWRINKLQFCTTKMKHVSFSFTHLEKIFSDQKYTSDANYIVLKITLNVSELELGKTNYMWVHPVTARMLITYKTFLRRTFYYKFWKCGIPQVTTDGTESLHLWYICCIFHHIMCVHNPEDTRLP